MIRRVSQALAATLVLAFWGAAAPVAAQSVAGRWLFDVALDAGSGQATFEFVVEGNNITGTYGGVLGELPITGSIEGNVLRIEFDSPDAGEIRFDGVLEGDTLEGTCEYGALGAGTFIGRRAA